MEAKDKSQDPPEKLVVQGSRPFAIISKKGVSVCWGVCVGRGVGVACVYVCTRKARGQDLNVA